MSSSRLVFLNSLSDGISFTLKINDILLRILEEERLVKRDVSAAEDPVAGRIPDAPDVVAIKANEASHPCAIVQLVPLWDHLECDVCFAAKNTQIS